MQMVKSLNIFLLAFGLVTLLYAGKSYFINEPAESRESLDLNLVEIDFEQAPIAYLKQESNSEILMAQENCGNESCSDKECCCLNIDTGAQCCRPRGNSANCVEACKNSKPC
jgi:hypothetical protein